MSGKNVEQITKEEFDKIFKGMIETIEGEIMVNSETYIKLLNFRSQYRKDYKLNRVIHYRDRDTGGITYRKSASRKMGFKK